MKTRPKPLDWNGLPFTWQNLWKAQQLRYAFYFTKILDVKDKEVYKNLGRKKILCWKRLICNCSQSPDNLCPGCGWSPSGHSWAPRRLDTWERPGQGLGKDGTGNDNKTKAYKCPICAALGPDFISLSFGFLTPLMDGTLVPTLWSSRDA